VAHRDGRLAKVATMLEDAEPDILAFYAFPSSHWRKLRSTNPLERFNRDVGRRTDVVASRAQPMWVTLPVVRRGR
jgi:putative transposase